MKKSLIFLLALSLLLLSACRSPDQQPDAPTATAYFRNLSAEVWGDWLAAETTAIRMDQAPVDLVRELVEAMRTPRNLAHGSLLEENIQLEHASLEDGLLILRFGDALRRMTDSRQLMLCTALSRTMSQCDGVERILVRDFSGLVRIEMAADESVTDPETLGVHAVDLTLFLNQPQGVRLEQVRRTVYTDREELTLEQTLELLLSLHGSTGLHAPFDGRITGYDLDSSEGICRIDLWTEEKYTFDILDVYGMVNTLAGVEGESRFLISINGTAPSAWGVADCDDILFYNTEYIG